MSDGWILFAASLVGVLTLLGALALRGFAVAQPDEWLLHVRGGRLVRAGIGVSTWRWPGDLVVRFSSTMQRVGFEAHALTRERIPVVVEGFVFWAVASEGDAPLRAFQRLGLANLVDPPKDLKHPKHLLTSPQHKAFQQLVAASVQRHLATLSLDSVLLDPDATVQGVEGRLVSETRPMGVRIDQVQITRSRPADEALLANLTAAEQERIREQAARTRIEAADRVRRCELEVQTALAARESDARRDRETSEARARLEVEREAARLLEEKLRFQRDAAERRQAEALLEVARKESLALREEAARKAGALAAEAGRSEVAQARRARREAWRAFELEGVRERALAARDAVRSAAQAEEEKSAALRELELRRHVADRVSESLRITDGKWISVAGDAPVTSLAGVVGAVGELLARPGKAPAA